MPQTQDPSPKTQDQPLEGLSSSLESWLSGPVRVAFVIDDLGLGGAQRQLVEFLKGLSRQRFEPFVISLSTTKTDYAQTIEALGIPLWQLSQSGVWDGRCFNQLRHQLRVINPSIVHTWLFTADFYGRLAAWMTRVPIIISAVRSVEPDKPKHYVLVDRLLRYITAAFTVNAQTIGEILATREYVARQKIHTIYNGVDLAQFDPTKVNGVVRRQLGITTHTALVGIVGRLAPVKDHETFLRAAAMVLQRLPTVRFVIVGTGPLKVPLQTLARTLGVNEAVQFLESQSNVAEVFAALDLVIVSSVYEGCSNVILEGMAMGKPVIATAVGGNPELIATEHTGVLVPVHDPQRLAEAIIRLIQDPQRAQAMGRMGRARIEADFTLEHMVRQTEHLYDTLLQHQQAH